jgi:hypothetical protein
MKTLDLGTWGENEARLVELVLLLHKEMEGVETQAMMAAKNAAALLTGKPLTDPDLPLQRAITQWRVASAEATLAAWTAEKTFADVVHKNAHTHTHTRTRTRTRTHTHTYTHTHTHAHTHTHTHTHTHSLGSIAHLRPLRS